MVQVQGKNGGLQVPYDPGAYGVGVLDIGDDVCQVALVDRVCPHGKLVVEIDPDIPRVDIEAELRVGRYRDARCSVLRVEEIFLVADRRHKRETVAAGDRPCQIEVKGRTDEDVGLPVVLGESDIIVHLEGDSPRGFKQDGADLEVIIRGDGRSVPQLRGGFADFRRAERLLREKRGPARQETEQDQGAPPPYRAMSDKMISWGALSQ